MSDYPNSYKYSKADVDEADRLYDRMPLREVAEHTGIPYGTLSNWSNYGYISTEANHYSHPKEWRWETVHRANDLYDKMPFPAISDLLGVPMSTLSNWRQRGWVTTDKNWRAKARSGKRKKSPKRAAALVHGKGLTQAEAAERMDLSRSTLRRYLDDYRRGRSTTSRA